MAHSEIMQKIEELSEEREKLLASEGSHHASADDHRRLDEIDHTLSVLWDLRRREMTENGEDWRGEAQLTMLDAVDASRRSEAANRRVEELREKFGDGPGSPPPPSSGGGFVQSPISQEVAAELSDDEWLDAIARYPTARLD